MENQFENLYVLFDNDEESVVDYLKEFSEVFNTDLPLLEKFIKDDNISEVKKIVHKLKSMLLYLNIDPLTPTVLNIHQSLHNGESLSSIEKTFSYGIELLYKLHTDIKLFLEEKS